MTSRAPITQVEASAFTVPTDQPEADGTFAWRDTTPVVVQVWTDSGVGLGWTYGSLATAAPHPQTLALILIGRSVAELGALWRDIRHRTNANMTAGEYGDRQDFFQQMCAAEAMDCLQVNVTRCRGITEFLRVAASASVSWRSLAIAHPSNTAPFSLRFASAGTWRGLTTTSVSNAGSSTARATRSTAHYRSPTGPVMASASGRAADQFRVF